MRTYEVKLEAVDFDTEEKQLVLDALRFFKVDESREAAIALYERLRTIWGPHL